MDIRMLVIELAEKIGLVATAGLVSVLVPPLRNRLLGVGGQPRDKIVALGFGLLLAMWGAKMGEWWLNVHVNVHTIGVLLAAVLGGFRVGALTGLLAGLFYVYRVEDSLGIAAIAATTFEGAVSGWLAEKRPGLFEGWRAFLTTLAIGTARLGVVAVGLAMANDTTTLLDAWPALLVQLSGSALGITIFVVTCRVVLAREEAAVALVEARAAADHLALEALRRRLEPHFLFNALNALRATIRIDPARARDLVSDLSDLYRYLLHHPDHAPLASEVEHAVSYLAIERARLGEGRLRVEAEVAAEVRTLKVPALLLQPLVENAVKHGVAAHQGEGVVRVLARRDGDALHVEVEDCSPGELLGSVQEGSGIALQTLRERLGKRYDGRASLSLTPTDAGMRAIVRIPWDEAIAPAPRQTQPTDHERNAA